jgi:hypothetical protein
MPWQLLMGYTTSCVISVAGGRPWPDFDRAILVYARYVAMGRRNADRTMAPLDSSMLQDVVTSPRSGKLKGRGCLLLNRARHRRVSKDVGLWRDQLMDFVCVVGVERGVSSDGRFF